MTAAVPKPKAAPPAPFTTRHKLTFALALVLVAVTVYAIREGADLSGLADVVWALAGLVVGSKSGSAIRDAGQARLTRIRRGAADALGSGDEGF